MTDITHEFKLDGKNYAIDEHISSVSYFFEVFCCNDESPCDDFGVLVSEGGIDWDSPDSTSFDDASAIIY